MTLLSITAELAARRDPRPKGYTRVHATHGYERGCGCAGTYPGHAHRTFYDVIFAPDGLSGTDLSGATIEGTLLIVPPRTYFGALTVEEFFFIKFSPTPGTFELPDKTDERLGEGRIQVFHEEAAVVLPWFPQPEGEAGRIEFRLLGGQLMLLFSSDEQLRITR